MSPVTGSELNQDAVWQQALDWFLLIQSDPDNEIHQQDLAIWLAEDEKHRRAYSRAAKVWALTGDPAIATGAEEDRQPEETVIELPQRSRAKRYIMGSVAALAASLLIIFGISWLNPAPDADYRTQTAEILDVPLQDGSKVYLDAKSAFSDLSDTETRRIRLHSGRAFFDVSPKDPRPFHVDMGEVTVRVTGTSFDMNYGEDWLSVSVKSGSVQVEAISAGGEQSHDLTPGTRIRINRETGDMIKDNRSQRLIGSWRTGRLIVENTTVAELVEEIRRHYSGSILMADPSIAGKRVTGVFNLANAEQALQAAIEPYGGNLRNPVPSLVIVSPY